MSKLPSKKAMGKAVEVPGISRLAQSMTETKEPEVQPIVGEPLPSYVNGIYIRTGPGLYDFDDFTLNHLFDGYAILSKFEIKSNQVTLTKKFLQSDAYKRAMAAHRPVIAEFGTAAQSDPNAGFFARIKNTLYPEFTDNNSSNVSCIGPNVFTFGDSCYFRSVDIDTLATKEKHDSNKLFNLNVQSAHPITDTNGDVWNVGYSIFTGFKFHVLKIPAAKTTQEMFKHAKIIATISSRWSGSMSSIHSFGLTDKWVTIVEQPFVVSMSKIASSFLKRDCVKDWLEWNAQEKCRFVLVNKKTGKLYNYHVVSDSFHFLHVVNAYEDNDDNHHHHIIMDVVTYPSPSYLDSLFVAELRKDTLHLTDLSQVLRFAIPILDDTIKIDKVPENVNLIKGKRVTATAVRQGNVIFLTPEEIGEKGTDMAVISPTVFAKKHNFIYGSTIMSQNVMKNKIIKVNTQLRESIFWKQDEHTYPVGEPQFLPDPQGSSEDDGILLCPVIDIRPNRQDFIIFLDKEMKEISRVSFNHDIPIAFHGIFISTHVYKQQNSLPQPHSSHSQKHEHSHSHSQPHQHQEEQKEDQVEKTTIKK